MSKKNKGIEQRKLETQEIARNLVEDLHFFREILDGETPSRAELRLLSTALRRIFLQQAELKQVASVRLPDFEIEAPDFSPFVRELDLKAVFFAGGGGTAFGVKMQAAILQEADGKHPPTYDHAGKSAFSISKFLSAKTVLWRGTWFSRKEIIEFVSNKMGGAHTGRLSNKKEQKLKDLSAHGSLSLQDGAATVSMPFPSEELKSANMKLSKTEIDFLMFETLVAMDFLVTSPKTEELIGLIEAEIADLSE